MMKNLSVILLTLMLFVFGGCGSENKSSTSPITSTLQDNINQAPKADGVVSRSVITTGESVVFDASGSLDADGDIVSYEWRNQNGKLLSQDQNFNRLFNTEGTYTTTLTITDDKGATATKSISVKVDRQPEVQTTPNDAPIAKATASATQINSGKNVHFEDDGSYDPDGSIVKYEWRDMDGVLLSSTKVLDRVLYYYPEYDRGDETTRFVKTLYVTDDKGMVSSQSFEVIVKKIPTPNQLPTVNAGADQTITKGTNLTLTAVASDPDGSIVSYTWKEESATVATTAFFSKDDLTVGTHIFIVTVKDDKGATAIDSVLVEVKEKTKEEVVNGYVLPPEPDPKINNSTLLGVDVNNNGIRDDVERLIIIEESKNPNFPKTHTAILLQYAWAWQKMLESPTIDSRSYLEEASACQEYFINKYTINLNFKDYQIWNKAHASIVGANLEDALFNTKERIKQRFAFNSACSGNIFKGRKAVLGACKTNIDMLGE